MSDEPTSGPAPAVRCPWCSAELPSGGTDTCPSCGATLQGETEAQVPGVTSIDPLAVLEAARESSRRPRSRLVSWLTGTDAEPVSATKAAPEAIAPPSLEVRREMLRMQMAAELEALSNEAEAMAIEEALSAEARGDRPAASAAMTAAIDADAATDALAGEGAAGPGSAETAEADGTGSTPPASDAAGA